MVGFYTVCIMYISVGFYTEFISGLDSTLCIYPGWILHCIYIRVGYLYNIYLGWILHCMNIRVGFYVFLF